MRRGRIAASGTAGTTPRRCAAVVACVLCLNLPSLAEDKWRVNYSFMGTIEAVRSAFGAPKPALQTKYRPTALVTVKIDILFCVGGGPFKSGTRAVLPMSHPEKALGPPTRAVGRTYWFIVYTWQTADARTIDSISVSPLDKKWGEDRSGGSGRRRIPIRPGDPKPKPLPPGERPRRGIYTEYPLMSSVPLDDICAAADGLVYWVFNHPGMEAAHRRGRQLRGTDSSCFGVLYPKKRRIKVLDRGLRKAVAICSAGNRVYRVEGGTRARGHRDGRLSVYDIDAETTKVLREDLVDPLAVAVGPDGIVYVLESGGRLSSVRKDGPGPTVIARDLDKARSLAAGPSGDVFVLRDRSREPGLEWTELLRFPPGGGQREVVVDRVEDQTRDIATDARGNVYLAAERLRSRETVTVRVLIGGDPRKTVPLSTDEASRLAVLPNGDLLVYVPLTLWQFKMKRKVEDLVRRR